MLKGARTQYPMISEARGGSYFLGAGYESRYLLGVLSL
jgi:hypothetical protein